MNTSWKDTSLRFEERARILVSQMTLEEKVSQMTYASSALSRFGIPEYNWWNESLHGVARAGTATVFPQAIGMAASFDRNRMKKTADIISDEARAKHHAAAEMEDRGIYKGLDMWSPNINIFRDPRWGRGHETYGEDPYLTGRMGVAFIRGLQGDDPTYYKLIATAKHYAAHSGPEELRHEFDARVSKQDMEETYLPAFEAAVKEAGVYSVMGAYNRVNGEPACGSHTLLERILRGEWGFSGYVVSDCGAVEDFYKHHKIVADEAESAAMAVNNGCDLCCGWVFPHLIEAVRRGLVTEETITRAATRLMLARLKLGMFDPPEKVPYTSIPYDLVDCEEHRAASLDMAEASLVLLKNDGILPLAVSGLTRIAVIGPNADSREALVGNYNGTPSETITVLEGIRSLAKGVRVDYAQGCSLVGGSKESFWGEKMTYRLSEAMQAAKRADVVVLCLGLNGEIEGEQGDATGDRVALDLPKSQILLAEALRDCGKPMVLVNMTGSAIEFPCEDKMNAILQAWYPGQLGGLAVARALFGESSPGGRLPVTFYRDTAQLPPFEDYAMEGRTYRFLKDEPRYPFGFGLSYTRFAYENLKVSETARVGEPLTVSVTLRNTGSRAGDEVAQLYIRHTSAPFRVPNCQLAGFERVRLEPGESREVCFTVLPEQLTLVDSDGNRAQPEGIVTIYIGGHQPDSRSEQLTGGGVLKKAVAIRG